MVPQKMAFSNTKTGLVIFYRFLVVKYGLQTTLLHFGDHSFEKFAVKVAKEAYFHAFYYIITTICKVLNKFYCNKNEVCY